MIDSSPDFSEPPARPLTPAQVGDSVWLATLAFADGSALIEYDDHIEIVDAPSPYRAG